MKKSYLRIIVLILCLLTSMSGFAQLSPMGALYFQNQYVGNPAMAGRTPGLNINMGVRKQWTNIPGSPTMGTLAADYNLNEKTGFGLIISSDKAGLLKNTRTVGTYAYHLPLNGNDRKLSFGLSLGFLGERLTVEDVRANPNDVNIVTYNERRAYVDGDFGVAYTSNRFSLQAALPNMKGYFGKDITEGAVDRAVFFSAISYKLPLTEGPDNFAVEPKMIYRGVKGFNNILDAGANLSYADNKVNFFGMYHTSKSVTFGLGLNYQSFGFQGIYSTATSALSNYATGNFEISMIVRLFDKSKKP